MEERGTDLSWVSKWNWFLGGILFFLILACFSAVDRLLDKMGQYNTQFRACTEQEFAEDKDILDWWLAEHGYAHYAPTLLDFQTNGQHVWHFNLDITRPKIDREGNVAK